MMEMRQWSGRHAEAWDAEGLGGGCIGSGIVMGRLISNDDAVSSAVVSPYQFSWRGVGFSLRNDIVP